MKLVFLKPARRIALFIFFLMMTSPTMADYIAGEEANKRGDRETAFKEFYAAAQNKEVRAYGKLGSMYLYGLGTPKDYQQAYIWFEMSYLGGENTGERFRDAASSMLPRDKFLATQKLAEAQRIKLNLGKVPAK